jgi:hypothetical protein
MLRGAGRTADEKRPWNSESAFGNGNERSLGIPRERPFPAQGCILKIPTNHTLLAAVYRLTIKCGEPHRVGLDSSLSRPILRLENHYKTCHTSSITVS